MENKRPLFAALVLGEEKPEEDVEPFGLVKDR